jgi:hypothetical protein
MIRRGMGFRKALGHIKERWKRAFYRSVNFVSTNAATLIAAASPFITAWFHRFVNFIATNAIPLTSLFIAACSLYLTIHSQSEDRAHKEMMIRPALTYEISTTDLTVGFRNDGLGPAVIVDFAYKDHDECLSVADIYNHKVNSLNIYKVGLDIRDRLFTQVFTFKLPTTSSGIPVSPQVNESGSVLIPGSILAAGKEMWVFRIRDDTLSEFRQDLSELQPSTVQGFMAKFFDAAMSLPISLRYCSMSGNYCLSTRESVGCKLNSLHEFPD